MYGITTVTTIVAYGNWYPTWILSRDGKTIRMVEWEVRLSYNGFPKAKRTLFAESLKLFTSSFRDLKECTLDMSLLNTTQDPGIRDRFTYDPVTRLLTLTLENQARKEELPVPVDDRVRHDMLLFCEQLRNIVNEKVSARNWEPSETFVRGGTHDQWGL